MKNTEKPKKLLDVLSPHIDHPSEPWPDLVDRAIDCGLREGLPAGHKRGAEVVPIPDLLLVDHLFEDSLNIPNRPRPKRQGWEKGRVDP